MSRGSLLPAYTGNGKGTRITVPLPSTYLSVDVDGDGQVGLYEWKAWRGRSALVEFRALDRDGDGFLTPREIQLGPISVPVPSMATASGPSAPSSPAVPVTIPTAAPSSSASSSQSSANSRGGDLAKQYFGMLDKDRSGRISKEEWQISRRIRSAFEQDKLNLDQMNETDFISNYVRLLGGSGK